jgi:hypothetical protein
VPQLGLYTQLGLYSLRRTRDGYAAVATWRPSNTGQSPEKRKRNLLISHKGIVDFGAGPRGYSPIDLVMAALNMDFESAFDWLEKLVDPPSVIIALKPKMKCAAHLNANTKGA